MAIAQPFSLRKHGAMTKINKRPPVDYIQRTKDQYAGLGYPPYAWVHSSTAPPFSPLRKPLSESKCALVASGGIYAQGQVAFHFKDDLSVRIIDRSTPTDQLRTTHFAYDLTASRQDPGCVFPLQTLGELERLGLIGEVSANAYTFMGGIYSSRRVREVLAPAIADQLQRDEVDVAVMVPV